MAAITQAAMEVPVFAQIVNTKSHVASVQREGGTKVCCCCSCLWCVSRQDEVADDPPPNNVALHQDIKWNNSNALLGKSMSGVTFHGVKTVSL